MNEPLTLDKIGNDVLFHIFKWLEPRDLSICLRVCSTWYTLIQDNAFWRPLVQRDLPLFPKSDQVSHWQHYNRNAKGITFKSIHVFRSGIYSAWGKTAAVWKRSIGLPVRYDFYPTTTSHDSTITCFAVRNIGLVNLLITGSSNGTIKVLESGFNTNDFSEVQSISTRNTALKVIEGVGSYLLTASNEGIGSLWKFCTHQRNYKLLQQTAILHEGSLHVTATVPHLNQFISVGRDNCIRFWMIKNNSLQLFSELDSIEEQISCISYCNFLHLLLIGTDSGGLFIYQHDLNGEFRCVRTIQIHTGKVTALNTVSKDKYILSAGGDNEVKVCKISPKTHQLTCLKEIFLTEKSKVTSISGMISQQTKKLRTIYFSSTKQINVITFLQGQLQHDSFKVDEPHRQIDRRTIVEILKDSPRLSRKFH